MANNENSNSSNGLNLGEIGMIRNILMGEQIGEFEKKFNSLQDQLASLEEEFKAKINSLEQSTQQSFSTMDKDANLRFEDIEKQLIANVTKLNNRIDKVSKDDKMRLGKMLEKISKQLIGE